MGVKRAEHGPVPKERVRERPQPAQQRRLLSSLAYGWHRELHQGRGVLEVLSLASGQGVADRIGHCPLLLVPRARPPMQRGYVIGLLREQTRMEHVGKEMVIAVQPALVVQRHDKEVAALQGLQPRLTSLLASHGITQ